MKSKEVVRALALHESDIEHEPLTALLFPLRFIGMGLLIAWLCCTHLAGVFPGPLADTSMRISLDTGLRIGDISTLLILGLGASRIGVLSNHRAFCIVAVIVSTIGTAWIGLIAMPASDELLIMTSAIPTAVGGAVLFCLWAQVYAQMSPTQSLIFAALSCVMAGIVSFIILVLQSPWGIVATALLPSCSFAAVILSVRFLPQEKPKSKQETYPLPYKLMAIMVCAGLISGVSGVVLDQPDMHGVGALHRVVATSLAGVVILVLAYVRTDTLDVRFLARVCLPLTIGALLFLAAVPTLGTLGGNLVSFLCKLAYVWFTIFILLLLGSLAWRFEVPSLRLFALVRASSELAITTGIVFRRVLVEITLPRQELFLMLGCIGIVIVVGCAIAWTREKAVNSNWGIEGIQIESKHHIPGPRERFVSQGEILAQTYGLTARETEIMLLIAQRKSRAEIEQILFLSNNTVKTHVRHLYAKLGVHTKAEVIALFDMS